MKRRLTMAVLALFCVGAPSTASAEAEGLMVGAAITNGSDSDFGLGARIEHPLDLVVPNLGIAGGLNVFFPSDPYESWWEVNAAALYHFELSEMFTPYAGAGIGYASWKKQYPQVDAFGFSTPRGSAHDSSFSLSAIGGFKLNFDIGVTPFVEARVGVGGGNTLEITAGALIGF